eukprot:359211-Chlamydomonas_euryale.AAC.1
MPSWEPRSFPFVARRRRHTASPGMQIASSVASLSAASFTLRRCFSGRMGRQLEEVPSAPTVPSAPAQLALNARPSRP